MAGDGEAGGDTDEAARALVDWLSQRYRGPVRLVEPPTSRGEGFDSVIHLVHVAGHTLPEEWRGPLVVRVKAHADRMPDTSREWAMHAWLMERGYPAPRMLHVFGPGELLDLPVQVMERARGVLMADMVKTRPWTARRMIQRLAELQVRLHLLAPDGFPGDEDLLDRRLRLTRHIGDATGDGGLRAGLERVEALAAELRAAPAFVCHGDFHPLNVLVTDDAATVIDWTDAGTGDRHGDVARTLVLLDQAAIVASRPLERRVLGAAGPVLGRAYRRAYERKLPLDDSRLQLWSAVHLLHGWAQAASTGPDRVPPDLAASLRSRFEEAVEVVT